MSATRRQFLKAGAAGGAALLVEVPLFARPAGGAAPFAPNPWISIDGEGTVTLVVGHSEMGQGVRTSLAMILAEELEADWSGVKIRQAEPGPGYDSLSTGGSDSVEDSWTPLRTAGAAARELLVAAAAQSWSVPGRIARRRMAPSSTAPRAAGFRTGSSSRRRRRFRCRRSPGSRTARTIAWSARP